MRHPSVLEILADRAGVVVAQGWGPSLANCMGISGGVCLHRGLFSIIWWRTCPRNFVVQTDNTATMSGGHAAELFQAAHERDRQRDQSQAGDAPNRVRFTRTCTGSAQC